MSILKCATSKPLLIASIFQFFNITKIYLHEQNSILGKVNLLFLPFSKSIFTNFDKLNNFKVKYRNKICHVGIPSDDNVLYKQKKVYINKSKTLVIFVYGGSQGSVILNEGFLRLVERLPDLYKSKTSFIIQSSNAQIENLNTRLKKLELNFEIKSFYKDINKILEIADITISRSGAGAINNIISFQVPSILIPITKSIYNHQYLNAKYLVDKKAAELIEEKDLYLEKSYFLFKKIIDNTDKRNNLIKNLQKIQLLNANELMLKKIIE